MPLQRPTSTNALRRPGEDLKETIESSLSIHGNENDKAKIWLIKTLNSFPISNEERELYLLKYQLSCMDKLSQSFSSSLDLT